MKYIILRRLLCVMVTCFSLSFCFGQRGQASNSGARSYGIGGISTVINGSDAILNNFSQISSHNSHNNLDFILSSANRFSLAELSSVSFGVQKAINKVGHIGMLLNNYGNENYAEREIALLYARQLGRKISISAKFGLYSLNLAEYGSTETFVYNIGISGDITDDLSYGFVLSNFERSSIDFSTDMVSSLAMGLRYRVSQVVSCYGEVEKELEQGVSFSVGLEYALHEKFNLRAGYNTALGQSGAGFSYLVSKKLHLDFSTQYHSLLGLSPSISIKFNKINKMHQQPDIE